MSRLISLLLLLACCLPAGAWKPLFVGHRGCLRGVENTAEAYVNGADYYGYDGLECDVRVTSDRHYVISHDETTTRLGGNLTVASATLAQLQAETYTQTRGGTTYTGHICTVEEYLDICVEKGVFPVLELKWTAGINNNDMSNFPGLANLIAERGLTDKAIILTSMRNSLEYVRTNFPELTCQWLCNANWKGSEEWCRKWGLNPSISTGNFDNFTVHKFHGYGLYVACWVVDALSNYKKYGEMGVAMMTCNSLMPADMPDLPDIDWGNEDPLEPLELFCDTLFMRSRYRGNLPDDFPSGRSAESSFTTAQQAAMSGGKFYANDYGSGTLLCYDADGRQPCDIAAGSAQGIAADDAGNLIIRNDGPKQSEPCQMILHDLRSGQSATVDFALPYPGRTHFISASGDVFSAEGGRVYFYPYGQNRVNIVHLSLGQLDKVTSVGPLSIDGTTAGMVYPLADNPDRFVYQVRNHGYYLYDGGDRASYITGTSSTVAPARNSSLGGALFTLNGHELFVYGSGANYNGGFTVRDMSADAEPLLTVPPIGGGGYNANPSAGAFFRVEKESDSSVILYEYCMGNGYAAYRLYTSEESQVVTTPNDNRQPLRTTYYNLQGHASTRPHKGVNIVVDTYCDGSTTARKTLMP